MCIFYYTEKREQFLKYICVLDSFFSWGSANYNF